MGLILKMEGGMSSETSDKQNRNNAFLRWARFLYEKDCSAKMFTKRLSITLKPVSFSSFISASYFSPNTGLKSMQHTK